MTKDSERNEKEAAGWLNTGSRTSHDHWRGNGKREGGGDVCVTQCTKNQHRKNLVVGAAAHVQGLPRLSTAPHQHKKGVEKGEKSASLQTP